ncbi:hypothetical protein HD806DRAFT_491986 [Xylariaceae sp. AK1471]|nr:hypothetical protein HD806DRAFT_491986 [Xylariaceae sp. AK1471]
MSDVTGSDASASSQASFRTARDSTEQPSPLPSVVNDPEREMPNLQLNFSPDNPQFVRARDDESLYWSNVHKELDHPELFTRAVKTRERLLLDLKRTIIKLSTSKRRRLFHGGKPVYDLEPPKKRYELRLTGRAQVGTNQITMTVWVWIQCSDKYSVWKIRKRIEELGWLNLHEWAPVYVHLDPITAGYGTL